MSQPSCHICGHELGLSPASRCTHQPLVVKPMPLALEDPLDVVELLLFETGDEPEMIEEVDPSTFDCIISGSVGGTLPQFVDDLQQTLPDKR